ncbi:chloroplastic group IIA intron splicing facilitator CRS1, chloroplastic isoform X1 [Typha latifolia]|uniref:chloroplastic group IIA intron splicing facilitator CRS1, chloroplastic isoform X1 n=1 Tax=Typha latifolia TaxID=4733 RepID=UPI003C2AE440
MPLPLFSSPLAFSNPHPPPKSTASNLERPHHPFLSSDKPWLSSGAVKMPTPPWMRGPLLLPPDQVLDLSDPKKKSTLDDAAADDEWDSSLTAKVRGGRGRRAMLGIIRTVKSLQETNPLEPEHCYEKDGINDHEVFEFMSEVELDGDGMQRKAPWVAAERKMVFRREKKEREVTAAERILTENELARLQGEARRMKRWVRAKKAGFMQEVVEEIERTWKKQELAMVKIVEPLRRNMDRAREIVETKTGGLVVWSKKDTLVVYRGINYPMNPKASQKSSLAPVGEDSLAKSSIYQSQYNKDNNANLSTKSDGESFIRGNGEVENFEATLKQLNGVGPVTGTLYEREVNRLLDELGPRFIDWWWRTPLPVDADLLPEVVSDFKTPFRQCPPGVRLKLTDDELTYLRMLAHPLPTHFALGKNRKLQGLAAAILKLWEKSLIAKIAIKVGIPNTDNEQMSMELKHLTGGVLILRNKFFIILYRGKDFLPGRVADSIIERETELHDQQLKEEEARSKVADSFHVVDELASRTSYIGTFREYQDIQVNHLGQNAEHCEAKIQMEADKERLTRELTKQERRLFILTRKIEKSEKELADLSCSWSPSEQAADQELLTEEERQAFQNIGWKMEEHLLLGRRGIYDGVIGNIHQHWKHREVVKIITMQKGIREVMYTARLLELESGGTLVTVEKLRSSHAIIIYRGKNYNRPLKVLPDNLLTKKEALLRSIEVQRRGWLAILDGDSSLFSLAYGYCQTCLEIKPRTKHFDMQSNLSWNHILLLHESKGKFDGVHACGDNCSLCPVLPINNPSLVPFPLNCQSLKYFARQTQQSIWDLKQKLRDLDERIRKITPLEYQM